VGCLRGAPAPLTLKGGYGWYKNNFILTAPDSTLKTIIEKDVTSSVRVEYSGLVEKGSGFIVITWHGKQIRLERSEYSYREISDTGQLYIVVPQNIYELKFK